MQIGRNKVQMAMLKADIPPPRSFTAERRRLDNAGTFDIVNLQTDQDNT